MTVAMGRTRQLLIRLSGPLVLLAIWYIVAASGLASSYLLPPPGRTFLRLGQMLTAGTVHSDIAASLLRWFVGYALGCVIGVPVGLLIGNSVVLYEASFPAIDFLRSLPVTALFPLFLLIFGIGEGSKMAMAFTATVFVVILNSASGAKQASRTRQRTAKVFGASRWQVFRWIVFWEALPQTLVGMRIALSLALIVVIVSEMFIGTRQGLGQRIYDAYSFNLTTDLYALLVITGLLGFAMNRIFLFAEKRIVFWAGA